MTIYIEDVLHQGLRKLLNSNGLDNTGISITWAGFLREALAGLHSATTLDDVYVLSEELLSPLLPYPGKDGFFSVAIVPRWHLTFCIREQDAGRVREVDIEFWPNDEPPEQ